TGTNVLDITATAFDGDINMRAYAVQTDVVVGAGETVVAFPGGWRTDFASFTASYVNVPSDGYVDASVAAQRFDRTGPSSGTSLLLSGGQSGLWTGIYPQCYRTG